MPRILFVVPLSTGTQSVWQGFGPWGACVLGSVGQHRLPTPREPSWQQLLLLLLLLLLPPLPPLLLLQA